MYRRVGNRAVARAGPSMAGSAIGGYSHEKSRYGIAEPFRVPKAQRP